MTARAPYAGMSLEGSTAFVTGGGSGIGLETVLVMAELGADVTIFDITPGAADRAAEQVRALGRRAFAFTGDTASAEDVEQAFAASRAELGDIDTAVACAGVINDYGPIDELPLDQWDRVLDVNLRGSFLVVRTAIPQIRRRGVGSIVLLSSLDGLMAEHGMAAYCTSKGAILNLMRSAALDVAREGIRVNAVCPSVTDTPLLRGRLETLPNGAEVLAAYAAKHPLGRVLQPRDIASMIAYLCTPLASGITGAAIPVDAGMSATWDDYVTPPWIGKRTG
jgi:NAD(P)-dependent dehydrogenase (short-subunit alcohol dehydrogenase family)